MTGSGLADFEMARSVLVLTVEVTLSELLPETGSDSLPPTIAQR